MRADISAYVKPCNTSAWMICQPAVVALFCGDEVSKCFLYAYDALMQMQILLLNA